MILKILIITCIFELATIIGRLIWGSKREKFQKNTSKYKVRIHHGYTGALMILPGLIPGLLTGIAPSILMQNLELITIFGWAFFLSDAIHHFIVLPLWVGRTEFP